MKNCLTILFLCFITCSALAQGEKDMTRSTLVQRMYYSEKINQPVRVLPNLLLKAFCEGEIQAYFPNATNTAMTFNDFLAHFGMGQSTATSREPNVTSNGVSCQEALCVKLDPVFLKCFSYYTDIIEIEKFDRQTSTYKNVPQFVRLVLSPECTYNGLEYMGPVFKYSDIQKLPTKYKIKNPENQAMEYTIPQFMALRLFTVVTIEKDGTYFEKPADATEKLKKKKADEEGTLYDQ
jgi:hypothetical protein